MVFLRDLSLILMTFSMFSALSSEGLAQSLDAINILSSCGNDCWTKDPNNKFSDQIKPEPEAFDQTVVKCMQICFASKTKKLITEDKLSPQQVLKIKVSSYCGHICYNNNKNSKKSLDYCYAGCLGTILQPRVKKGVKSGQTTGNNSTIDTSTSLGTQSRQ